jgi:hypothetical protein
LVPQFNVLWLDPMNPDTFPAGLLDAVTASTTAAAATATTPPPAWSGKGEERSMKERLREQMQADALQPLDDDDDDDDDAVVDDAVASLPKNADFNSESHLPPKWIEDAAQFLHLNVSHDLTLLPSAAVVSISLPPSRASYFFPFLLGIG